MTLGERDRNTGKYELRRRIDVFKEEKVKNYKKLGYKIYKIDGVKVR